MSTVARRKYSVGIGLTPTVIGSYTAPAATTGTFITYLSIANTLTGPSVVVTVDIFDGTTAAPLVVSALIMQGGNILFGSDKAPIPLNSGDQVRVTSNLPSSCAATLGVAEIN